MVSRGNKLRRSSRDVKSAQKRAEREKKEEERWKARKIKIVEQRKAERKRKAEEEENREMMKENIRKIKHCKKYRELTKIVEKLEREIRELYPEDYEKREPVDKSNKKGDRMVNEVFTDGDNQSAKVMDARAKRRGETKQCKVDYIISTEERAIGSRLITAKILVKSTGYSRPSWEKSGAQKGRQVLEMKLRQARLDFVEFVIRQLEGDAAFESSYPRRYLTAEDGEGQGGYLEKRSPGQYKNQLRALEFSFNQTLNKYHLPPIFIEDWTAKMEGAKDLRKLEFIQSSTITAEVKQLLKENENGLGDAIRCGEACRTSGGSCDSKWHGSCCARNEALEMIGTELTPRFIQRHQTGKPCSVRFECTSACACDPKTCGNRIVQRGRKHPLLIFFHPVKGWTIRTLTEMGVWDLIGEYVGVMQTEPSKTSRAKAYDVDLQYPVKLANGRMGNLFVVADAKGNETRFLSHGCDPNVWMEPYIIERHGLFNNTMAFFPYHSLIRGEECVFEYMPDMGPEDEECHYKMYFDECSCGSHKCRFTKEKIAAAERARAMEADDEDDGDGSPARRRTRSSVKRRRLHTMSDEEDS